MTSILIVSQDAKKRDAYIKQLCVESEIDQFDVTIFAKKNDDDDKKAKTKVSETKTIGIADIRTMQQKLYLKPLKSKTKAIVIENAELMTPEAQNALLKVLEEPPLHTIIILSAATKEAFLPTVLSRCKIVALQEEVRKLADDTKKEIAGFITQLATFGTADALMLAERVGKNKDQALEWLQNAIIYLHEKLKEDAMLASTLQEFHATYKVLKSTNTNPRLALENMFLSLTTAKK